MNAKLLIQTLEAIKENLDKWNQAEIDDDVGRHCFAGFAILIDRGLPLDTYVYEAIEDTELTDWNEAKRVLDLTSRECYRLFHYRNTLDRLEEIVDELVREI